MPSCSGVSQEPASQPGLSLGPCCTGLRSLMDLGRRQETPGSETKGSMTQGAGGSLNFLLTFASVVLAVPQGNAGLSGC